MNDVPAGTVSSLLVINAKSYPSSNAVNADQRQPFRGANHLVEQGVHEVDGTAELPVGEMTFPHLHGNAFCRVPGVRAEAVGTGEPFYPKACLGQGLDGTRLNGEGGVEGKVLDIVFFVAWGARSD